MSRCLGERALLRVLEGEPARLAEEHLEACAACRARLHLLQDDLDRLAAALHGAPPAPGPATARAAWRLALPALALAGLAAAALLLGGGGREGAATDGTADESATTGLVSSAGLGAALEGGDGVWSDWATTAADGDEVMALRAALHGARPCAVDERMIYASCDETALAGWSPDLAGEEVGR